MTIREDVWDWAVASQRTLWLAAYPRSGITMARHLLLSCFGLRSDSLYNDDHISNKYAPMLNAVPHDETARDEIAEEQGILPIKTHRLIPSAQKVIVIARDGRTTLQSLRDFYAEMCMRTESLADLISGNHPWGDWSAWVKAWDNRRNTLWVHYEDMRSNLRAAVSLIGGWLGRDPIAYEIPSFAELNEAHPYFFRQGNRISTWGAAEDELFWSRHGETMESLGYGKD